MKHIIREGILYLGYFLLIMFLLFYMAVTVEHINNNVLKVFVALFGVILFTAMKLDYTNEDSISSSVRTSVINIFMWSIFWTAWTIYVLVVYLDQPAAGMFTFITYLFIASVPAVGVFAFTWYARKYMFKDYPSLTATDTVWKEYEGELRSLSFRYFSGFYGMLTIPVFCLGALLYWIWTLV